MALRVRLAGSSGNGTYIPPPPDDVALAGYTKLAFYDHFTDISTIDVNDTRAAGFKWYTHNAFPSCLSSSNANWTSAAATPSSSYSVSNSILTITPVGNGGDPTKIGGQFRSVAYQASAPGYVGTFYNPGWYYECRVQTPTGQASSTCWMVADKFLLGGTPIIDTEFDVVDPFDGTYHSDSIAWNGWPSPTKTQHPVTATVDFTTWRRFGIMWQPTTDNSGTGKMRYYIDGVEHTGANAPLTYTSSNDLFQQESQKTALLMGCYDPVGGGAAQFDYVALWQR